MHSFAKKAVIEQKNFFRKLSKSIFKMINSLQLYVSYK